MSTEYITQIPDKYLKQKDMGWGEFKSYCINRFGFKRDSQEYYKHFTLVEELTANKPQGVLSGKYWMKVIHDMNPNFANLIRRSGERW
jgi:hypothetical protein